MRTLLLALLLLLPGCAVPDAHAPPPPATVSAPEGVDETWTLAADALHDDAWSFRLATDRHLSFGLFVDRFAGGGFEVRLPLGCGSFSLGGPGVTTLSGTSLGTVQCTLAPGTHRLVAHAEGVLDGTLTVRSG